MKCILYEKLVKSHALKKSYHFTGHQRAAQNINAEQ